MPARLDALPSADRADIERGRVADPTVRASDLAHIELETARLGTLEAFYGDFGLVPSARTEDAVYLRAAGTAHHAVVLRRAEQPRVVAVALRVPDALDLRRLASLAGASPVEAIDEPGGGQRVRLRTPGGLEVHAVHGIAALPPLPIRPPILLNAPAARMRVNATQRPPCAPAEVLRLGHVALETRTFFANLLFWLRTFGLIVSDYQFLEDRPEFGPVMAFMRCDRGADPADHHTVAVAAGIDDALAHAAFETQDLDTVAAGGEHLRRRGWRHAWGIGRHILGSQLFDYWRDPDGVMVEHFADGDVFDASAPTGRLAFRGTNLAQWGPPLPPDFIGGTPGPALVGRVVGTLAGSDETTLGKLIATVRALAR